MARTGRRTEQASSDEVCDTDKVKISGCVQVIVSLSNKRICFMHELQFCLIPPLWRRRYNNSCNNNLSAMFCFGTIGVSWINSNDSIEMTKN